MKSILNNSAKVNLESDHYTLNDSETASSNSVSQDAGYVEKKIKHGYLLLALVQLLVSSSLLGAIVLFIINLQSISIPRWILMDVIFLFGGFLFYLFLLNVLCANSLLAKKRLPSLINKIFLVVIVYLLVCIFSDPIFLNPNNNLSYSVWKILNPSWTHVLFLVVIFFIRGALSIFEYYLESGFLVFFKWFTIVFLFVFFILNIILANLSSKYQGCQVSCKNDCLNDTVQYMCYRGCRYKCGDL